MNSKILGLLAVGLLAGPMLAAAEVVTWELKGEIDGMSGDGRPFFPEAVVGDQYRLLVTFDTNAVLLSTNSGGFFAPGVRYRYDPSSLRMRLFVNGSGPVDFDYEPSTIPGFIDILDNTSFPTLGSEPWDGISFNLLFHYPDGSTVQFGAFLRGSNTDIFDGPGIPKTPDPRLLDQEQTRIQVISTGAWNGENGSFVGDISSVVLYTDPEQLLSDLVQQVVSLNIATGIGNALDAKLQNALDALDRAQTGDTASATGILYAFIQSVEAQSGKKLTTEQANQLVSSAQAIIDALNQL